MTIDNKIWLKIAVILSLIIKPTGTFEAKHCQEMSMDVKKVKYLIKVQHLSPNSISAHLFSFKSEI